MSDDDSKADRVERSEGPGSSVSVTRHSGVTENLDTVFELLSDARRRYLLYYLFAMDGTVAEFEAAVNAVYRYEVAGSDGDGSARENVGIALHHSHLPHLADAGVIDYDRRHGTIRFTGSPALEEWLEHAQYKELD
jgi:hypothetical protein